MKLFDFVSSPSDYDKSSILAQIDQAEWPQQLRLLKPLDWDKKDQKQRIQSIQDNLGEINLHIELRACFLDLRQSHLSKPEFDDWYDRQILQAHYLPIQPLLKRKQS